MNGLLKPSSVLHNNALEATWKWIKSDICQKGDHKSTIPVFTLASEYFLERTCDPEDCMESSADNVDGCPDANARA
jgi:hypothetical protein